MKSYFFYNNENNSIEISNRSKTIISKNINILNFIDRVELTEESVLCLNAIRSISKYAHIDDKEARRFLDFVARSNT